MPEVTPLARAGRIVTCRPDIGEIDAYGSPTDSHMAHLWPAYSLSIWEHIDQTPELVLIDGRFRVSCFLQALLRLPTPTKYVIHDMWSRSHYGVILQFASVLSRVDDLAVVQARSDVDWRSAGTAASRYLLDPR